MSMKVRKIIKQKPKRQSHILDTFTSQRFGRTNLLDTGFRAHGQPVYSLQINGEFTREEIYNHMDLKSKDLQRKDPLTQFQVVLRLERTNHFGNKIIDYRAGKFVNAGEHPDIWSPHNYNYAANGDEDEEGEEVGEVIEMPKIVGFYVNMIKRVQI